MIYLDWMDRVDSATSETRHASHMPSIVESLNHQLITSTQMTLSQRPESETHRELPSSSAGDKAVAKHTSRMQSGVRQCNAWERAISRATENFYSENQVQIAHARSLRALLTQARDPRSDLDAQEPDL